MEGNAPALLALISDLYTQIIQLKQEVAMLSRALDQPNLGPLLRPTDPSPKQHPATPQDGNGGQAANPNANPETHTKQAIGNEA